jgi:hypothetical protein
MELLLLAATKDIDMSEAAVLTKLVLRGRFGRTIGVYVRNLGSRDERATV